MLRGRPGTKALPLAGARAVGGPVAQGLFAALAALALGALVAATAVLVAAAPALAAHDPGAWQPVLAVHLLALGFLPAAVTAAAFHLLPVMLRNDLRRPRLARALPPLLAVGMLAAPGVAFDLPALLWCGVSFLTVAAAVVLAELLQLVVGAPRGRTLVASRAGVGLVCLHVAAAFALGGVVFAHGDEPVAGVSHGRWLLVHLHLAVVGWLLLLIVTVARNLAPMLAQAPVPRRRRLPLVELALTGGLWLLAAGIAVPSRPLQLGGGAVCSLALTAFAVETVRVVRTRRGAFEAPLAQIAVGVALLAQAAALGFAVAAGAVPASTALGGYVVLLLLGFAGGVTAGHLGKLLSLSLWVWWPPGPRPRQDELYPRRLWLAEAGLLGTGVELAAWGSVASSETVVRAGGVLSLVAALLAAGGSLTTWSRRARPGRTGAALG